MRLILFNEGVGNFRYNKGYSVSRDVLKELENFYWFDRSKVEFTIVNRLEGESLEEYYNRIYEEGRKGRFVAVGGDHSVTFSLYRPFKGEGILVFDAHPDLESPVDVPTNEDWLRLLIESGEIKGKDVYIVGVRNPSNREISYAKEVGVNILYSSEIENSEDILDFLPRRKRFYVSIDIDVFDPAFAPGTFYREPFGLYPREVLDLLDEIEIISADITEINKDFDVNNITIRLASSLCLKLLEKIFGKEI